jgi:hypothetical protein
MDDVRDPIGRKALEEILKSKTKSPRKELSASRKS